MLQTDIDQIPAEWRSVRALADLVIELSVKIDALTAEVAKIPKAP